MLSQAWAIIGVQFPSLFLGNLHDMRNGVLQYHFIQDKRRFEFKESVPLPLELGHCLALRTASVEAHVYIPKGFWNKSFDLLVP